MVFKNHKNNKIVLEKGSTSLYKRILKEIKNQYDQDLPIFIVVGVQKWLVLSKRKYFFKLVNIIILEDYQIEYS